MSPLPPTSTPPWALAPWALPSWRLSNMAECILQIGGKARDGGVVCHIENVPWSGESVISLFFLKKRRRKERQNKKNMDHWDSSNESSIFGF